MDWSDNIKCENYSQCLSEAALSLQDVNIYDIGSRDEASELAEIVCNNVVNTILYTSLVPFYLIIL